MRHLLAGVLLVIAALLLILLCATLALAYLINPQRGGAAPAAH